MTNTKVGTLIGLLDNNEEIFSISVPPESANLLTAHTTFDVSRISEFMNLGASTKIAMFTAGDSAKIIIRGIDQPIVNLDYHNWPIFSAGTYAVYLMPRRREGSWLGPIVFAYTKLEDSSDTKQEPNAQQDAPSNGGQRPSLNSGFHSRRG